jgi:hypothetical protein
MFKKNQKGLTALVTLVIISFVALLVALSVNLISISEMQMGFEKSRSAKAFWAAEACLDEALIRLKRNPGYLSGSLTIDSVTSCTISIAPSGNKRIITTVGAVDGIIIRRIEAQADVSGRLTLDYWKELSN